MKMPRHSVLRGCLFMHKKISEKLVVIVFCIVLCLSASLTAMLTINAAAANHATAASNNQEYDKTVIIDPGHGGPDGGAVGVDGTVEKGINLAISLKLRSFFITSGFKVIMTREDDRTICDKSCKTLRSMKASDLHNRLKIANKYPKALFISIHQNIYESPNYSGAQVFYSANNTASKVLAQSLQTDIANMLQPQNKREIKPAQDNLFLLYNAKSPAVMVECGFLSSPSECKKLEDDDYQNQMAFAIFYGTLHFYSELNE
jgi:N-acetylmuramoyl-L-alanine amidase